MAEAMTVLARLDLLVVVGKTPRQQRLDGIFWEFPDDADGAPMRLDLPSLSR